MRKFQPRTQSRSDTITIAGSTVYQNSMPFAGKTAGSQSDPKEDTNTNNDETAREDDSRGF